MLEVEAPERYSIVVMDNAGDGFVCQVSVHETQLDQLKDPADVRNFWHRLLDQMLDEVYQNAPSGDRAICPVCGDWRELRVNGTSGHICSRLMFEAHKVCKQCGCLPDAPGHVKCKETKNGN